MSGSVPAWEIHQALARIAHLADDGSIDEYLEMFTQDAVWETPAVAATGVAADLRTGRADIGAGAAGRRASGVQGPGSATRHVITTIEVLAGAAADTAESVCYFSFYRGTTTEPVLATMGRYDDQWRLSGEGWRLAYRRITLG